METPKNIPEGLKLNTEHTILSEYEEHDFNTAAIEWKCMVEVPLKEYEETVIEMLSRSMPQRITCPGLQAYLGIVPVEDIFSSIDIMLDAVRGTQHVVAIPTFIFRPALYHLWSEISRINHHIWMRSAESATPLLHLHKNFLCKQGRSWVCAGRLFTEFEQGTGLGSQLNREGLVRYTNRLFRFHCAGFTHEIPMANLSDSAPLPLNETYLFTENLATAALLEGAGFVLTKRPARGAKKAKGAKSAQAVPMEVETGDGGDKPECAVVHGVKRQRSYDDLPTGAIGRGRGRAKAGNSDYSLISIDKMTFKGMIKDNGDLRGKLREEVAEREAKEKEIARLRKTVSRSEADMAQMERRLEVANSRVSDASRKFRKSSEEAYQDAKEWREERDKFEKSLYDLQWENEELTAEVEKVKGKLSREKQRYAVLESRLEVWEGLGEKSKKKKN